MDPFISISLIAGLLALDDRAGWQGLLAQPVFASAIVGFVAGNIGSAIAVGVILEIIYMSILPMRGLHRPDHIAAGVVGGGTAALIIHYTADPRFALIVGVGVFTGLVAGEISSRVTMRLRNRLFRRLGEMDLAQMKSLSSATGPLLRVHAVAMAYIFAVHAAVVWVLLRVGYAGAERVTRYIDGALVDAVVNWYNLLPMLGVASLVHLYWHEHHKRMLLLAAVITTLILGLR
jgi:mannose/fructose/N-acetylgalactosamine-specific phosphotransferase system component IIC